MFLLHLGVLLLSAATLLYEITLTRVFSVAQWYHFAFMVVSLGMLGFGASGSFLSLFPRLLQKDLTRSLSLCALLFSLGCVASYLVVNTLPFDSYRVAWDSRQLLYLVIYYLSLAVPFFFTGLALGAALSGMPSRAAKIYAANMVGSGLGCLLVLAGPPLFGGGGTVALAALLGLAAVMAFAAPLGKLIPGLALGAVVGIVVLLLARPALLDIRMSPYKSLSQVLLHPEAHTLSTEWNAFSRVDVVESSSIHIAPGLSFSYDQGLPSQLGLAVDGANLSPITQIEPDQAALTDYLPGALAYQLTPSPRALIIEPGGGLDILAALYHQSSSVTAVVSNPLVVQAIKGFGPEGLLSGEPAVELAVEGPRSYLRASEEQFDLIHLSLTDSFQVVAAGSYSLSESYLYTVEAFEDCYRRLAPGGVLCATRWVQTPPSEGIRLMSLVTAALEGASVTCPEQQVAAIRSFQTITVLVKKEPLATVDIAVIRDFCDQRGLDVIYFPGISAADLNRYNVLPQEVYYQAFTSILSPSDRQAFLDGYSYDVSPPTDDRPFFFHFFRWSQAPRVWRSLGKSWQPFGGAGYLVVSALLLAAVLASAAFILFPIRWRPRRRREDTIGPAGLRRQLFLYFSALGLGFMFIEVPLLQKFILFLDKPAYAFAIVLFTIFVCSGLGSLLSARLLRLLPQLMLGLALLTVLYLFLLPHLFQALLGQSLALRLFITVLALAPLSILMGIPFPSGVRLVGLLSPSLVPWAWAVNGCLSVVSSILSLMIALWLGFSWALAAAAAAYLMGAGVARGWMGRAEGVVLRGDGPTGARPA